LQLHNFTFIVTDTTMGEDLSFD